MHGLCIHLHSILPLINDCMQFKQEFSKQFFKSDNRYGMRNYLFLAFFFSLRKYSSQFTHLRDSKSSWV